MWCVILRNRHFKISPLASKLNLQPFGWCNAHGVMTMKVAPCLSWQATCHMIITRLALTPDCAHRVYILLIRSNLITLKKKLKSNYVLLACSIIPSLITICSLGLAYKFEKRMACSTQQHAEGRRFTFSEPRQVNQHIPIMINLWVTWWLHNIWAWDGSGNLQAYLENKVQLW